MKGSRRLISCLQLSCVLLLLLGSYTGLAQSQRSTNNSAEMPLHEQVNINLADAETIAMVLEGVGLRRAEAIVDYRETNGDFTSLDELTEVSGIGEVTLRNNVDKILLSNEIGEVGD